MGRFGRAFARAMRENNPHTPTRRYGGERKEKKNEGEKRENTSPESKRGHSDDE